MIRKPLSLTAIVTFCAAGVAQADVTPEQVWENWQAMFASEGQNTTVGNVTRNGDSLDVSDLTIVHNGPMGDSVVIALDSLSFKDNGDGTVTVVMPEEMPISMAFPTERTTSNLGTLKLMVSQPDMKMIASGSAEEMRYDFSSSTNTIVLEEITDATGKPIDTKGELAVAEMTGNHTARKMDDQFQLDSSYAFKSVSLEMAGQDPTTGEKASGKFIITDVAATANGTLLGAEIMADLAVALNSGFAVDTSISFGSMSLAMDVVDKAGPVKLGLESSKGDIAVGMNKTKLDYSIAVSGTKLRLSGPEIPFPQVELGLGDFAFNLAMPLTKSEEPQPFSFLTKFIDLTIPEDVWGLFDPAGKLSHEPATFIFDVNGTGTLHADIAQPLSALDAGGDTGELNTLKVVELRANAAGAEASATGDLTFDNTDLVTFDGMPKPSGTITLTAKGVQSLIDNMIALGLIAEDEAVGLRMMLSMFARPGGSEGELVSLFEFKDGGLFVNGQKIL